MELQSNKAILKSSLKIIHIILSIALGLFFIYAGAKKFMPKPAIIKPIDNTAFIEAFETNIFENPLTFKMSIKALKVSGFLYMVGVLQLLAGLLILLPLTRLIGLLILLPITVNIFCFHFFMDNRVDETIETGIFLALNSILTIFYYQELKQLIIKKNKHGNKQF